LHASFLRLEREGERVSGVWQPIRVVSPSHGEDAAPSLDSGRQILDRAGGWRATRNREFLFTDLWSPAGERWRLPAPAHLLSFSPGGKRAIVFYPLGSRQGEIPAMALDAVDLERRAWRPTRLRTRLLAAELQTWIDDRTVLVRLLIPEG